MTNSPFVTINLAAAEVAAYRAAVQLGLLDRIDRAPATAAEAANSCGISRRGAHAVLTALHRMGVLDRDEFGCYRPVTAGLASLHPMVESWRELPDVVRTGQPADPCDRPDSAGHHYPATVRHLSSIQPEAAEKVAGLLPPAARVLDVGAGAAPWSLAYARRHRHCSVTALDLAGVLPVTRRAVHAAGLTQRFDYLAGDVFSVPLPDADFDLIIVGNFCHLFDATTNRVLLARLAEALRPGGALAIIDVPPGDSPELALYGLSLVLRTAGGGLHKVPEYQDWLAKAALAGNPPIHLAGTYPLVLITAVAPPPIDKQLLTGWPVRTAQTTASPTC